MMAQRAIRLALSGVALLLAMVVLALSAHQEASAQSKPTLTLSSAQQAAGITEGQQIVFTVTADQPVSEDMRVFGVAESGGNFIGNDGSAGRAGTMKAGTDTLVWVQNTHNNDLDEVDGYVRMRLSYRSWYTIDEGKYLRVAVRDNDDPPAAINAALEQKVIERIEDRVTAGDISAERKWRRALRAIRQDRPMYGGAMTESEARQNAVIVGNNGHTASAQTWTEVADEIANPSGTKAVSTDPIITVSTTQGFVVEGGTATFTLHASAAPDSPIQVNLRVRGSESWPTQTRRSVTVSSQGDTSFTVATQVVANDVEGTLSVVIEQGTGYKIGSKYSAGMSVRNLGDPRVDVNSSGAITEGQNAVFTFSADPKPNAPLTVNISVTETGSVAASSVSGITSVTIPTSGSTTLTIPTVDDSAQEEIGKLIVRVHAGNGYTKRYGDHTAAGISVLDNDLPAVNVYATQISVTEGEEAVFAFTTTPITQLTLEVKVSVTQTGDFATASLPRQQTVIVLPGGSNPAVKVATADDSVDEDDGSISVTIQAAYSGYVIGTGTATIAVLDDDGSSTQDQDDQQDQQQDTQQQSQDDDSTFTPDQALVDLVQQKVDSHSNPDAAERLQKIVNGMTGEGDGYTASECRSTARSYQVSSAWKPWCDEIERRENAASSNTPPPPPDPTVTISAGAGITEGASAQFTLTASPAPAPTLDVTVDVTQSGDFATTGSQTVTIPATGSITFTVPTTDDSTDEPDGSVTATLQPGTGYAVGAAHAATVGVSDDDDPPQQQIETTFTPDQALVDLVQQKVDSHSNPDAAERLQKIVNGMTGEGDGYTASECRSTARSYQVSSAWKPWCDEIERRENAASAESETDPLPPPPPPPEPELSITGSAGVVEGGTIVFTITATPAPDSPLHVNLELTESGSFTSTGTRTVTVPITGVATLAVSTTDDSVDESDGSVTLTLTSGPGYTIGSQRDATVSVSDNDDPPPAVPELAISGGADVTEGGDTVFTITASPTPSGLLTIDVAVTQSGDFAAVGTHSVTIRNGVATLSIATVDDANDEAHGSVTATLQSGNGYTLGSSSSATIKVSDNDDPPPPPPPPPPVEAGSLDCGNSSVIVDAANVAEPQYGFADLSINVRLCEINYARVMIEYHMEGISADSNDLYLMTGTLIIEAFQQERAIKTLIKADGVTEGDETVALVLTDVHTYGRPIDLGPGRVLVTITDHE